MYVPGNGALGFG